MGTRARKVWTLIVLLIVCVDALGEFPMECVSLVSQPQFAESRRVCIRGKAWALGSEFGDTQMIFAA